LVRIKGFAARNNPTVSILQTNKQRVKNEGSKMEMELRESKKGLCCFQKQKAWEFQVILEEKINKKNLQCFISLVSNFVF